MDSSYTPPRDTTHTTTGSGRKRVVLASLIAAALVGSGVGYAVADVGPQPASAAIAQPAGPHGFAHLIATVKPAVVNIATTADVAVPSSESDPGNFPLPPNSPYGQFLRHFFGEGSNNGQSAQPHALVHALGSGFIISPDGYVVTNNHVIKGARKITVILEDGDKLPAKIVGHDPKTDLALLKIESKRTFPYVAWGDSQKARTGNWVVAIGNPFGLGGTATAGIISARGRYIHDGPYDTFLQVDAPINKGNSGGPLFNERGKVIGINTAIYSPNGGSVGIGFAIPSDVARPIIAQLKAHGYVERGHLGVEIQPVTQEIADSLGLKSPHGALVASVSPHSPASRAGVEPGDVIDSYNGHKVDSARDLALLVANTKPGQRVTIGVWHEDAQHELHAVIGLMPGSNHTLSAHSSTTPKGTPKLGLELAPMSAQSRSNYDVPNGVHGALVVGVENGSPAAQSGLETGDVIEMIGQHKVHSPEDVARGVRQAAARKRHEVLLLVERNGHSEFVIVPLTHS